MTGSTKSGRKNLQAALFGLPHILGKLNEFFDNLRSLDSAVLIAPRSRISTFGRRLSRCDVRTVQHRIIHLAEPAKRRFFDDGFGEAGHRYCVMARSLSKAARGGGKSSCTARQTRARSITA